MIAVVDGEFTVKKLYPDDLAQVCNLCALPASDMDAVLAATEVGEVWGVGRRIAKQLQDGGINTVLDLVRLDPATVRSRWGVVLERTVRGNAPGTAYAALHDKFGMRCQWRGRENS